MSNLLQYKGFQTYAICDSYIQEVEEYMTYIIFECEYSLKNILILHLNTYYVDYFGGIPLNDFEIIENFYYRNEFRVFSEVLISLKESVEQYYNIASQEHSFDSKDVRIKFLGCNDYLLLNDAIKKCQNIFLNNLPVEKKLNFLTNIIFQCHYDSVPYGFLKQQELKNINFYAFVYFISIDLRKITIEQIDFVAQDQFAKHIIINPFYMHHSDINTQIMQIFRTMQNGIKKNNGQKFSALQAYKRVFDVHLYMDYYLPSKFNFHKCIMWLEGRGHRFLQFGSLDNETSSTCPYNVYIREDIKTIEQFNKVATEHFVFNDILENG